MENDSVFIVKEIAVAVGYPIEDLYFIVNAFYPAVVIRVLKGVLNKRQMLS